MTRGVEQRAGRQPFRFLNRALAACEREEREAQHKGASARSDHGRQHTIAAATGGFASAAHVAGRVMGIEINATLVVSDERIGGDADDPGLLVRGFARSYITKKLQKYMHPQYAEP